MVTGFSVVLHSRLHLMQPSPILLRIVLACIVLNVFLFHVPVIVITIHGNAHFTPLIYKIYSILSWTEVVFSVQETMTATINVMPFFHFTKGSARNHGTTKALRLLVAAEGVVLIADIVLTVLLYTKYYLPRMMIQPWVSVEKLQIEFVILNW